MQDGFDPYHKWLGVPPQEQPPHHYRLLAIPLFESDPDVIESAADQRMGHVRTYQRGPHSADSQQILNQLAAARICLLSPEKKLAYDSELQAHLAPPAPTPPPQPSPISTILPSPPPPPFVGQAPPLPVTPSQAECEIISPPSGSLLSQPSSLFPPLDATLPDPAPPLMTATRATVSGRSGRRSLVTSAVGIALLLCAAIVFWVLYSGQRTQDAATLPASDGKQVPATPHSLTPPRSARASQISEGGPADEATPVVNSPDVAEDVAPEEGTETGENREPATPLVEERPEPAVEPSPVATDIGIPGTDAVLPARPSLAEVLEQAMPVPSESQESVDRLADAAEKSLIPRPASFKRVAKILQAYAGGDCSTLLAEAQKPDRPSPHVYVLLKWARDKAVLAHNGEDALRAIEITESKFMGSNYDQERIVALNSIQLQLMNDSRQSRALAATALQASQDALDAKNKPLAVGLGGIAFRAAQSSRQQALEQQIGDYLRGL